jgi:bifunctional DNA-binding transcriptional regulator/antitoxin component of YhaV-PrlF toxin-antitoxin module
MNGKRQFRAVLIRPVGTGTWTYVRVPLDVQEAYGAKGQVKVKACVNGVAFRGSLMPQGDGTHYLVIPKAVRDEAGVTEGNEAEVAIEPDTDKREIVPPPDVAEALSRNERADAVYGGLAYSHQKAYVDWIVSAKKPETRQRRIEKAMVMLAEGKKFK